MSDDLVKRLEAFDHQCKCSLHYVAERERTVVEIGFGHPREQFQEALARIEALTAERDALAEKLATAMEVPQ